MRWLDPTNDYVFKILFSDPANRHLLVAMLEAIIEPSSPITELEILNPELPAELATQRMIVLDVRARTADGSQFDIEMETWPKPTFRHRIPFTWSRLHSGQLGRGEPFSALKPTISIAWLARSVLPTPGFHSRFGILDRATGFELSDHLQIHLLELPKRLTDGTLSEPMRRWASFFGDPTPDTFARLTSQDPIMADTIKALRRVTEDEIHYHNAETRWLGEMAYDMGIDHARREGAHEARVAFARKLLDEGFESERVASLTELPQRTVEEIRAGTYVRDEAKSL